MLKRALFVCGLAAALLYVATVILGGFLRPGYDHLNMAVSVLVEKGAPNGLLLEILFSVSFALFMAFAWAVGMGSRGEGLRFLTAGSLVLGLVGLLGIVMTIFFPADPAGAAPTVTGAGQVFFSYGISLGLVITVFFLGLGSKMRDSFWFFSIVLGVLELAAQVFALALAAKADPILGLVERIAMGLFLVWIAVYIARLFVEDSGRL